MVVIGVVVFATASALCGATPTGDGAEAWLIVFRIIQGAGAALMFPAALAIVLDAFPVNERGRAMAIFFAIAGGLTSIGPIAGGYLRNRPTPSTRRRSTTAAPCSSAAAWGCSCSASSSRRSGAGATSKPGPRS
jgi:MFS family permease